MSTDQMVPCGCCGEPTDQHSYVDLDLEKPVCIHCKSDLQWAHAQLRRRTPDGVSITGIHGPREKPIRWDHKLAQDAYDKWLKEQG